MIEKRIVFRSDHDECSVEAVSSSGRTHLKLAKQSSMHPEIREYVESHILPNRDPRYLYVLVSALGAGEIWGPNTNGDYFTTKDIIDSHQTFVRFGYAFTHHQNKDPKNSIGNILLSVWNPRMHRVELLVRLDRERAPQITKDIESGKMWDVSMGCKVKFDVCSICQNHAYTRDEYCDHLKHHMGKVLPDGRQVYAINPNPRFFDISFVWIGADPTAKSLAKVASKKGVTVLKKESSIVKEVPGGQVLSSDAAQIATKIMRNFSDIREREPDIPTGVLGSLSRFPLPDVLSTLLALGIVLKPLEFRQLIRTNPPSEFRWGHFNEGVVGEVIDLMNDRSAHKPYLCPRVIKLAAEKGDNRPLVRRGRTRMLRDLTLAVAAAALYKRYLDEIPHFAATGLDSIIKKNPWLLPVITAGAVGASSAIDQSRMQKTAANLGGRVLVGIPAAYLTSHIIRGLNSDNKALRFIAENPLLVALLGVAATNTAEDWRAIRRALESFSGQKTKTDTMIRKLASLSIEEKPAAFFLKKTASSPLPEGNFDPALVAIAGIAVMNGG